MNPLFGWFNNLLFIDPGKKTVSGLKTNRSTYSKTQKANTQVFNQPAQVPKPGRKKKK